MTNGVVIYVSPVVSPTPGVEWGGLGTDITALTNIPTFSAANMDFGGESNTEVIVAQLGGNGGKDYAAKVCADLVAYGFDDWYLPAAGELNEISKKLGPDTSGIGQIRGTYWSSSEKGADGAWSRTIGSNVWYFDKKDFKLPCRCIRK